MRGRGFTLIEVMIVLVIVAITATAVSFSLEGMRAREIERELARLRLVLETAGERAAVTGTPVAVEFLPGRYRFSTLSADGQWQPAPEGDSLAEHPIPEEISWGTLLVEGHPPAKEPPLIFGSQMPDFELHLNTPTGEQILHAHPDGAVTLDRPVVVVKEGAQ